MQFLTKLFRQLFSILRRHPIRSAAVVLLLGISTPLLCDLRVAAAAEGRIYDSVESVPKAPVALLLGTAKEFNGYPNSFYTTRITAAAELFKAGKVRGILVSGDNGRTDYNEPEDMRADLVLAGVPEEFITLDYAGFRTLDSVVRAKEIFGQDHFVVVSQRFHLERAIYLARKHGIEATGYTAADPPYRPSRVRIRMREVAARSAAVADVVIRRGPKFLGKAEEVKLATR